MRKKFVCVHFWAAKSTSSACEMAFLTMNQQWYYFAKFILRVLVSLSNNIVHPWLQTPQLGNISEILSVHDCILIIQGGSVDSFRNTMSDDANIQTYSLRYIVITVPIDHAISTLQVWNCTTRKGSHVICRTQPMSNNRTHDLGQVTFTGSQDCLQTWQGAFRLYPIQT